MIERSFKFFLIIFLTLLIANTNVFAFHKKKGMQKTVYEDLTQKEVQGEYCTNNVEKKFKKNLDQLNHRCHQDLQCVLASIGYLLFSIDVVT